MNGPEQAVQGNLGLSPSKEREASTDNARP
jgi:hypothetical protein